MIKTILFDLDGVLVDACEWHYETLNKALKEVLGFEINRKDHETKFNGLSTKVKLKMLQIPDAEAQKIWQLKQDMTWSVIDRLAQINPEKRNLHLALKWNGYKLACVTNAIRRSAAHMLKKTGQLEFMEFILSNEDVQNNKPAPDCYVLAMEKLGVSPEETLIVEDSEKGKKAAYASGAHVLEVRNATEVNLENLTKHIDSIHDTIHENRRKPMNVLIPMAGAGSRFQTAGYSFPKPLIEVHNKPMIQVAVENLDFSDKKHIFICQKKHYEQYALKYLLNLIRPESEIVTVDKITQGAASTTLLAKEFIDNDEPLIIANSDQYVEWVSQDFIDDANYRNLDGSILTFTATHPKWSFAKLNEEGYVTEVAEKKPISDIATVGIYYWRKGSDYVKYAEQMIQNDVRFNNEFYVCPVYNEAIRDGKKIGVYSVKKMWGLGTPEDLAKYLKNHGE